MGVVGVLRDDVGGCRLDGVEFGEMREDEGGVRVGVGVAEGGDGKGNMGVQYWGGVVVGRVGRVGGGIFVVFKQNRMT